MIWRSLKSRMLGGLAQWLGRWAGFLRRQAQFWASVAQRSHEAAAATEEAPWEPGTPPAHWLARIQEADQPLDWMAYRASSMPQEPTHPAPQPSRPPEPERAAPPSPAPERLGRPPDRPLPERVASGLARLRRSESTPPEASPPARTPTADTQRGRPAPQGRAASPNGAPKRLIPRPGTPDVSGRGSREAEPSAPASRSARRGASVGATTFAADASEAETPPVEAGEITQERDARSQQERPTVTRRAVQPGDEKPVLHQRPWQRPPFPQLGRSSPARTPLKSAKEGEEDSAGERLSPAPASPGEAEGQASPERPRRDTFQRDEVTDEKSRPKWPRSFPSASPTEPHRTTLAPEPRWDEESPQDRWPALPEEAFPAEEPGEALTTEDWETQRRAWQRLQRLDEEQKGNPWSVSPF